MLIRVNAITATSLFFLVIYLLAIASQFVSGPEVWPASFINSQILTNNEFSFAELSSALLWLGAVLLLVQAVWKLGSGSGVGKFRLWLVFYMLLSVFAFGEEISWGDHFFDYSSPIKAANINSQQETNLHNLNLSALLDVSEDSVLYPYLTNATFLLNPLFYLIVFVLWVLLPLAVQRGFGSRVGWLQEMPRTSQGFQRLFIAQCLVYLAIDQLWFNVGYIFEFFIAFAALLVALEAAGQSQRRAAAIRAAAQEVPRQQSTD